MHCLEELYSFFHVIINKQLTKALPNYWTCVFSFTAVFCTGGRDGNIMVWDTRCSKKGTDLTLKLQQNRGTFVGTDRHRCWILMIPKHWWPYYLSLQMVTTDRSSRSAALTTKLRQTPRPRQRKDGALHAAWPPAWWVWLRLPPPLTEITQLRMKWF